MKDFINIEILERNWISKISKKFGQKCKSNELYSAQKNGKIKQFANKWDLSSEINECIFIEQYLNKA